MRIPEESRLSIKGFDWLKNRWLQEEKLNKAKKLEELAKKLNVFLTALSIAWTIKNPNVTTAILGATKTEQLEENLKATAALPLLTSEVMDEIEKILQNKLRFSDLQQQVL